MRGQELFNLSQTSSPDIFLGEYPCDIPFSGGNTEQVAVSLTWHSPRSKHGIPVLALEAGHTMYFTAREQTPAGHAAKLVADWLNEHDVPQEQQHRIELFLWQWPGIEQDEQGHWVLCDRQQRMQYLNEPMVDTAGHNVSEVPRDSILRSGNLQVSAYGYCRKPSPCFLLDACLTCPLFITNRHFIRSLHSRIAELEQLRDQAALGNNQRMVDACQLALTAIDTMIRVLEQSQPDKEVTQE